ncbi:MAG TPA: glucokinase [Candidatus Eisenbacteria bacterium]|nr:glucokinase [Candidatus Eisenbacteria bacterium]
MILAGDIGGTKASLALFEHTGNGTIGPRREPEVFRAADFESPEALLAEYLRLHPASVDCASLGVAGPPVRGHVVGTNLAWPMNAASIARRLGAPVYFLNDLEASGYGIPALAPEDLVPIQHAAPEPDGNAALIAAGTGLGESILARVGGALVPVASEGGHGDFAARTDEEIELFRALRARHGRVSYETVVSGQGLARVAEWTHGRTVEGLPPRGGASAWKEHLANAGGEDDLPSWISRSGIEKDCPWCERALEIFVSVFGAEAGNLALRCVARSGVYLAGGIAPKILPALDSDTFRRAFADKPPHRELLASIPVWVVRNEHSAVLGAARYASLKGSQSL